MIKRLRLGIVGYAGFGQRLAASFRSLPEVEIVGVFNRGEERRRASESQGLHAFADYAELLAQPGLQAVAIATANLAHAEQCITAARAGKHIFCEKPLTLDLATFDEVLAACEQAGVVTHLDFTMRYGSGPQRLLSEVHSGRLGRPLSLWVQRCRGYGLWAGGKRHPDIVHPEISGGWNLHHNVHGTDLLLHLARERVAEVYCKQVRSSPEAPCEELISALVTFASGAIGHVNDAISIQREEYMGVIGERGSALLKHGGEFAVTMEDGSQIQEMILPSKGLGESCRAFVSACLGQGMDNIPFASGRHSLEVLLAMNRSAAEGRAVRLS
jgi:myo-inositol 2-dehydrogenase/D-chiro-inositol 1-dehydrogenase